MGMIEYGMIPSNEVTTKSTAGERVQRAGNWMEHASLCLQAGDVTARRVCWRATASRNEYSRTF